MKYRATRLKVLFLLFSITMGGCDQYTEIDLPNDRLTGEAVFKDPLTAEAALLDIYANMRQRGMIAGDLSGLSILMGSYSDELDYYGVPNSSVDTFYSHSIIASNDLVATMWELAYNQIYAANALVEGLDTTEINEQEEINRIKGEALFIRAFLHFYLVNLFGEIPYVTTTAYTVNSTIGRTGISEVYDNIISDLIKAEELLPVDYKGSFHTRPNKMAARALLARTYLYADKNTEAVRVVTSVINSGLYPPEMNLEKAFLKTSSATIWQLHSGEEQKKTLEAITMIPSATPPDILSLREELVSSFETGDMRKQAWVGSISDGTDIWYYPYKYKNENPSGTADEYSIILRIEELYLIRAEAYAQTGNLQAAVADLNVIRNRAGLQSMQLSDEQSVLNAVIEQWRLEFFSEMGHRWFDLKRWNMAGQILPSIKPGWRETDMLLPIPENEIILNDQLQPQNPGY
ncbi:RagB/SusD family nutrient uptake outer membrane protein [Galbibacter pacificus]|uniref:RagB/SusD family nutrient uptake outer membrane protein n=1 Tax=Galbibacter pacificus TaxID=2996052 RepID=A0ABT6FUA8_9FLAO|nr:RagB/SusD family nutrient uptake outer membrane protein [Galbibacter pacificus]MDG3583364.1 RagB/SusD family nutrient uptake outer membrane protein [Galbibacter pacificus]MDG3586845.1 RagB/SusD family nutrient uptake outer membrane protein [Galbibacter pacificus]